MNLLEKIWGKILTVSGPTQILRRSKVKYLLNYAELRGACQRHFFRAHYTQQKSLIPCQRLELKFKLKVEIKVLYIPLGPHFWPVLIINISQTLLK